MRYKAVLACFTTISDGEAVMLGDSDFGRLCAYEYALHEFQETAQLPFPASTRT